MLVPSMPDAISTTRFVPSRDDEVVANKTLRRDLDAVLQRIRALPRSGERSTAIMRVQEAVMWLGMDLKRLNEPTPYPSSYDPTNAIVEPTADGLKL